MSERDRTEPADGPEPPRRRPGARALDTVSDVLARLVPRSGADDRAYEGTGAPMSDEEIREAFRLASLTVTPAPLGLPSRKTESAAPGDQAGAPQPDGRPAAPGSNDATTNVATANSGVGPPTTTRDREPDRPAATDASSALPASVDVGGPPAAAWAPAPAEPPTLMAIRTPAMASEPDGAGPAEPDPDSPDQVQLPGNLGFSVDDFFGGLVRRIERRP
jgi:hypothetical protein